MSACLRPGAAVAVDCRADGSPVLHLGPTQLAADSTCTAAEVRALHASLTEALRTWLDALHTHARVLDKEEDR